MQRLSRSYLYGDEVATAETMVKVLVFYLVFTSVFYLTGFVNLIPVGIIRNNFGLKAQTLLIFLMVLLILGPRGRLTGFFRFPFAKGVFIFFGFVFISMMIQLAASGEDYFRIQRESGTAFSVAFFLVCIAIILLMNKAVRSLSDIHSFLITWGVVTVIAVVVARISTFGIKWYDLPSLYQVQDRQVGLLSYSVTEVQGRYFNREAFLWLDTNYYGTLVVLGILIGLYFLLMAGSKRIKVLLFVFLLVAASSLLATYSRSAVVQLLVGLLVFSGFIARVKRVAEFVGYALSIILVGVVALLIASRETLDLISYRLLLATGFVESGPSWQQLDGASMTRYVTAVMAWEQFLERPFFGSGGIQLSTYGLTSNHSEILDYLAQFGLFVSISFFILTASVVRRVHGIYANTIVSRHRMMAALLIAMNAVCFTHMITDPSFYLFYVVLATSICFVKAFEYERRLQAESPLHL